MYEICFCPSFLLGALARNWHNSVSFGAKSMSSAKALSMSVLVYFINFFIEIHDISCYTADV